MSAAVPEGWKLVPIEYTGEQIAAAYRYAKQSKPRACDRDVKALAFDLLAGYRELVQAAPQPPEERAC